MARPRLAETLPTSGSSAGVIASPDAESPTPIVPDGSSGLGTPPTQSNEMPKRTPMLQASIIDGKPFMVLTPEGQAIIDREKTLSVTSAEDAKEKIADIQFVGNGNLWQLLSKASSKSEGWMKSSKGMEIAGMGVVVQVTTQTSFGVAEAVTFVPGVKITDDVNGGRKLVPRM